MTPNVSVVIATYNRGHLLKNAIDSVLAQTYGDYELIIADDGSSDDTAALVDSYRDGSTRHHDRIQYFYQENQGKSVALNNALAKARGKWIAFLDSDDVWLPEKLEWQFRAIEKFPECGVCFTDCQFVNNPKMDTTVFEFFGRHYDDLLAKLPSPAMLLLESPCALIITLLCRKDVLSKSGTFDPVLRFTEDYDFTFRMAAFTDFCLVNLPLAMADRSEKRHAGPSVIWDDVEFRLKCEQYRFEKWLGGGEGLTAMVRKRIMRGLRSVHSGWANWHLAARDYGEARRAIWAAARYEMTANLVAKLVLTTLCPSVMRQIALRRGFEVRHF
jgi:glycosyltransferase involved in cell wall biosynthesis